jgi:hypothetical protein
MKYLFIFIIIQNLAFSQDFKSRLDTASTTEEIVKYSEKLEKFGKLQSATFKHNDDSIFAIWTEPREKEPGASFIQVYRLNNGKWKLFIDEVLISKNISVRLDPVKNTIIFISNNEKHFLERKFKDDNHKGTDTLSPPSDKNPLEIKPE